MIEAGVAIGEIFVEKYRVDEILGYGGMGVVALCTHLALNEQVAIKMLRREVLDDEAAVERFMREAQAAVKLKSEYVARVTDVGRAPSNIPYMVMEYLRGHDLGDLLEERGTLGLPWAIELTLQACEALAEAHSHGIVHRDVKPTNLFVTWRLDGSTLIKVLDFGISKALNGKPLQLTQTQSLLGTPAYMSPEQMRSARMVDARTDIWSLGTVLYEMLEGHRPFEAESFSEMCVKVAVDPPGTMVNTPLQLQQVVLRCLEKLPEQRYVSMAEFARDLVPFAHDPHQAQVLVERMKRMLERSPVPRIERPVTGPGSGGPGSVGRPDTGPVHPEGSTERAAVTPRPDSPPSSEAAPVDAADTPASGAEPVPRPLSGAKSEPRLGARSGSRSGTMSATIAVPRRGRRRQIAMIAIAVAVAASLGVMLSLARGPDDPLRAAEPRLPNPPHREPARPEPPATTAPAAPSTAATIIPAAPPAPASVSPAPDPAAIAPPPDDDRRAASGKVITSPSRRTPAPARPAHSARTEHAGAAQKRPVPGQKLDVPCDPADDQHGTKCRRTTGAHSP